MDTPDPDTGSGLLTPGQELGAPQDGGTELPAPRDEPAPAADPTPAAAPGGPAVHDGLAPAGTGTRPGAGPGADASSEPSGPDGLARPDGTVEPPEPDDVVEVLEVAPPVVAVLVTSDPGPWLEDALASLAGQEYPSLSVLVLDNGSVDDPTPRIAQSMPHAFVRRLPGNVGFAAAANEVMATVEGATFFLFCHDDVVLAPDAVRVMVEEAYRSNAGVVGPKLVDYDTPDVLLEVGMAVDHYGVPFSGIEPGEVDQEQHDAVRDVFFVSDAVMLVRADLFNELDGFDAATFPGFDDVDLCWRARLAGARVLVAPDACVRHRRATLQDDRPTRRDSHGDLRAWTRGRVRVLMKSYSPIALLWVLPAAFVLNLVEAGALVVARQPRRASALISGWLSALRQLPDIRRARADAQRLRRVDDGDVRDLMVRGSARMRTFLGHRLHAGDRLAEVSTRTREAVSHAGTRLRSAPMILTALIAVLLAVGSRSLLLDRVPEIGALRDWPGAGSLWSTFLSPWRYASLGADAPGPPIFGLMAALSTALLGDSDLARTLVVAGAFPLGAWGAFRLARPLAPSPLPAAVAALAYVVNPVVRNAIGEGLFGPLVTYALAPFLLGSLLRAGAAGAGRRTRVHATLAAALLVAVIAAAWPPGIACALAIAVAFALAAPFVRGFRLAARTAAAATLGTLLAFVLLAPWSIGLIGADSASLGLIPHRAMGLVDILAFQTGRAGSGAAPWGLIVAGLLPLAVATGPRLAWAGRAWMLTFVAWAVAWLPTRFDADAAVPAVEGVLVLAALGLALAVGLGLAAFVEELRTFHFGWRQLAAVVAALGLALPIMGLAADALQGRWGLAGDDWAARFAWMDDEPADGGFRVLWLGDPTILPADAHVVDGTGYALTRDGAGDVRALWAPPRDRAERELVRAIELARSGRTLRLGHLLAPAGVRYIAVVERAAPESGARAAADPRLETELASQLDLTVSRLEASAVVYENEAWIPRRALVAPETDVPAGTGDPLGAAARFSARTEPVTGPRSVSDPTGPGTILWSEAADGGWNADANGNALRRADAFGWTNAFSATENSSVAIAFDAGPRRVLVWIELLAWVAVAVAWFRSRHRRPEERS